MHTDGPFPTTCAPACMCVAALPGDVSNCRRSIQAISTVSALERKHRLGRQLSATKPKDSRPVWWSAALDGMHGQAGQAAASRAQQIPSPEPPRTCVCQLTAQRPWYDACWWTGSAASSSSSSSSKRRAFRYSHTTEQGDWQCHTLLPVDPCRSHSVKFHGCAQNSKSGFVYVPEGWELSRPCCQCGSAVHK